MDSADVRIFETVFRFMIDDLALVSDARTIYPYISNLTTVPIPIFLLYYLAFGQAHLL